MINYSKTTYIANGSAISLKNFNKSSYVSLDTCDYKLKSNGIHPFLENRECRTDLKIQTKFYIFNFENPKSNDPIMYDTPVCFMTQEEYFICGCYNGDIVFEKLREKGMDSSSLPPNSRFSILALSNEKRNILNHSVKNNSNSKSNRIVAFDDDIVLRSSYGYYLSSDAIDYDNVSRNYDLVSCLSTMVTNESTYKIVNSEVPYIPDWTTKRKNLNFNNCSYFLKEYYEEEKIYEQKSDLEDKLPLMSRSKDVQEKVLIEDLLLNLLGFEGEYIKRKNEKVVKINDNLISNIVLSNKSEGKFSKLNLIKDNLKLDEEVRQYSNQFEIEPYLEKSTCDSSLNFIINRILPITTYYDKICSYINFSLKKETGIISKSFGEALRIVLKEYTLMVNNLEVEYLNNKLDIQQLWYLIQKPLKVLESISRMCNNCFFLKGGNLINCIYDFLQSTSDIELQQIYLNLLERSFIPYMEMLKNWICLGYLDDYFDEFMVCSDPLFTKENIGEYYNEMYWEKKFSLNESNIPKFLLEIKDDIFSIGKSLILLKECEKIIICPFEHKFNYFKISPNTSYEMINLKINNSIQTNTSMSENPQKYLDVFDINFETDYRDNLNEIYLSIINNIENINQFKKLVKFIFDWSNKSLLSLVILDCQIFSILNSAKKVFFMESGDFYSYFIDLSDEYLNQEKGKVEFEKLENLFFSAQNLSSLKTIQKDLFKFSFSNMIIRNEKKYLDQLIKIVSQNDKLINIMTDIENLNQVIKSDDTDEIKVLETITIDMLVEDKFLLNMIFSKRILKKYQLLFRQLILLKYQEKKLSEAWIVQKNFSLGKMISYLRPSYFLRDKMLNFIKNISHYIFHEVIETNYHYFIEQLIKVDSFNSILELHNIFLDKCLKESFLSDFELMTILNNIIQACLFYSGIVIKFYNSAFHDETLLRDTNNVKKQKYDYNYKLKKKIELENELVENVFVNNRLGETIREIEKKFDAGLEVFLDKLSKMSLRSEDSLGKLLSKLDYNNYYFDFFSKKKFYN